MNIAVLSASACLLLILTLYLNFLSKCLAVCYLRAIQLDLNLITVQNTACNNIKLLITDAINKCLVILYIILKTKCLIFFYHTCERTIDLIFIRLILCTVCLACIWLTYLRSIINKCCTLCGNGITCGDLFDLCQCTNISCAKLWNLNGFFAAKQIQLRCAIFCSLIYIINAITSL